MIKANAIDQMRLLKSRFWEDEAPAEFSWVRLLPGIVGELSFSVLDKNRVCSRHFQFLARSRPPTFDD